MCVVVVVVVVVVRELRSLLFRSERKIEFILFKFIVLKFRTDIFQRNGHRGVYEHGRCSTGASLSHFSGLQK